MSSESDSNVCNGSIGGDLSAIGIITTGDVAPDTPSQQQPVVEQEHDRRNLLLRRSSSINLRRNTTVGNDGAALPSAFYCPLTLSVMRAPVIDREGNSYEKNAIEYWLSTQCTSPITRNPLRFKDLSPNRSLKEAIAERMGLDWLSNVSLTEGSFDMSGNSDEDNNNTDTISNNPSSSATIHSTFHTTVGFMSEPRRIVSSFLGEISSAVGKQISLNSAGICAFTYESFTIVIEVPASVRSFFIYTEMAALDNVTQKPYMMEKMLQLNYLQQETRGGCLSLDNNSHGHHTADDDDDSGSGSSKAIFSYTDRVDEIDASDFRNILENFIDSAMKLHKLLTDMNNEHENNHNNMNPRSFHRSESC